MPASIARFTRSEARGGRGARQRGHVGGGAAAAYHGTRQRSKQKLLPQQARDIGWESVSSQMVHSNGLSIAPALSTDANEGIDGYVFQETETEKPHCLHHSMR